MNIHRQLHIYGRVKSAELNELYLAMSLKTMALTLVGIFIPIYLYSLGYTIGQIFLYYGILYLAKAFINDLSARLIVQVGPKHTFVASFPFLLVYLWMIKTLPEFHWNIIIIAIISGAGLSLSWLSYHVDFSKAKRSMHASEDLSRMQALLTVASAIAPFVGGLVATNMGISSTFTLSIVILAISSLPLLFGKEPKITSNLKIKKIRFSEIKGDFVGTIGLGFNNSALYEIWPFLIFFIVGTYENVGTIESLTLLLTVFTTIYIGKHIFSKNRHKVLSRGAESNGLLWAARVFTSSVVHIFIFNFIQAIVSPLLRIPFFSELYLHADEEPRVEYLLWNEIFLDVGRALMFFSLAILALSFSLKTVLIVGVSFGIIGSLMTGFIRPAKDEV